MISLYQDSRVIVEEILRTTFNWVRKASCKNKDLLFLHFLFSCIKQHSPSVLEIMSSSEDEQPTTKKLPKQQSLERKMDENPIYSHERQSK